MNALSGGREAVKDNVEEGEKNDDDEEEEEEEAQENIDLFADLNLFSAYFQIQV